MWLYIDRHVIDARRCYLWNLLLPEDLNRREAYLLRNSWDLFALHVVNSFPDVVASWLRHATNSLLCDVLSSAD